MSALTPADFPEFFERVWGYAPFGWQTRLLQEVCSEGWPSTLDLPTGSGKTATLDIALFALALDAFEKAEERRQPRRIALVVDRRVVVDQAYERAVRLAETLKQAKEGIVFRVAEALRALQNEPHALPVLPAILRGGMPRESEWAGTPHQPVLLVSTVDQVGSRLLFRGYGVSDRMKPVHAGLLGRDTLYLLDEVHLSRPFEETLAAVAHYSGHKRIGQQLPRPLTFVRMSATLAERPPDTFVLDAGDREHPVLASRLRAQKHALLRKVKTPRDGDRAREAIAKSCVHEVRRLGSGSARAIAVIVNRVDTARRTALLARSELSNSWDVKLMTGRMRPLDRTDLQAGLLERIRAGRHRTDDRVLLVSTQAVEAGADFDFDSIVTECASLDALRQRFGRLDRFGELGVTDAVVIAASNDVNDKAESDPIYGGALRATWIQLKQWAEPSIEHDGSVVDFGIDAVDSRLSQMDEVNLAPLLAPRAVAPVLVPSHIDRWAQTSPIPSADPDVAAFLHGSDRGAPDVQIVWRADIDVSILENNEVRRVRDMLAVVPPSALEALSIPLWTARSWLAATSTVPPVADVEGAVEHVDEESANIAPVAIWRGDDTVITKDPNDIRTGDTLVVPSGYGGLDAGFGCWDPAAQDIRDRGDEAFLLNRGRALVRWNSAVLNSWMPGDTLSHGPKLYREELEEHGKGAEREAFEEWRIAVLEREQTPAWAKVALGALRGQIQIVRIGEGVEAWRATSHSRALAASDLRRLFGIPVLSEGAGTGEPTTEDDGGSFTNVEISLNRHLSGVQAFARRFAQAVGLSPEVVNDLALSGWLHDLGKADPRFQLMLHGGDAVAHALAAEPLAKSAVPARDREARERARRRSGYPQDSRETHGVRDRRLFGCAIGSIDTPDFF